MTFYSPRVYLYKITFEEVPYYYYGVHKETKFNEEYWGSPITHKWAWEFYIPKKQILEIFEYSDEGWLEALRVESRLIGPFFNSDKWCLNENVGGKFSLETRRNAGKIGGKKIKELGVGIFGLTPEQRSQNGRKCGKKTKELGVGIHGRTIEQMTEDGIKGGKKAKELGLGIHGLFPEQRIENAIKGGKKTKELGVGVHGRTKEQIKKDSIKGGKISGKKHKENKTGIFGLTSEQTSENARKAGKIGGKKSSSQKWKCLETGFITNPGNLTKYQRVRGIDTSKRVRIS